MLTRSSASASRVSPEEEESLDENTVHVHRLVHELIKCKIHKRLNFNNQSSETSLIVHHLVQV